MTKEEVDKIYGEANACFTGSGAGQNNDKAVELYSMAAAI